MKTIVHHQIEVGETRTDNGHSARRKTGCKRTDLRGKENADCKWLQKGFVLWDASAHETVEELLEMSWDD